MLFIEHRCDSLKTPKLEERNVSGVCVEMITWQKKNKAEEQEFLRFPFSFPQPECTRIRMTQRMRRGKREKGGKRGKG